MRTRTVMTIGLPILAVVIATCAGFADAADATEEARTESEEATGFFNATFGAGTEDVKQIHPDASEVPSRVAGVPVTALRLEKQTVLELPNCSVEFHFVKDALYEVAVDCGREADTLAALKTRFGEPTQAVDHGTFWLGEKTNVAYNPVARTYALSDRARHEDLTQMVIQAIVAKARAENEGAEPAAPAQDQSAAEDPAEE